LRLRYVHIHDLTALAEAGTRPLALSEKAFTAHFGAQAPVILATTGYPADVHALLGARHPGARLTVLGYRDPGRPLTQAQLLAYCRLDDYSLWQLATHTAQHPTEATAS
jgi:xylulose-5-phosphate/fructose-6-phosphate phosphoketolase